MAACPDPGSRRVALTYYGFGVLRAKRIKVCPACGAVCPSDESFCSECGAGLPEKNLYAQSVEGKQRCPHCGSLLGEAKNFCSVCGGRLHTTDCF